MKKQDVRQLKIGIYRLDWKSGGSSIAAVGCLANGDKWMAPLNWLHPSEDVKMWRHVQSATLLEVSKE